MYFWRRLGSTTNPDKKTKYIQTHDASVNTDSGRHSTAKTSNSTLYVLWHRKVIGKVIRWYIYILYIYGHSPSCVFYDIVELFLRPALSNVVARYMYVSHRCVLHSIHLILTNIMVAWSFDQHLGPRCPKTVRPTSVASTALVFSNYYCSL